MDAEKIARAMAGKAGGKVLRFRETPAQVIVLLTDGRKLYYDKAAPEPEAPAKPMTARKSAPPKEK